MKSTLLGLCTWLWLASSLFGQAAVGPRVGLDSTANSNDDLARALGPLTTQSQWQPGISRLQILELEGPIRAHWIDALSARGIVVLAPLPRHCQIVLASNEAIARASGAVPIKSSQPFVTLWKVAPGLLEHLKSPTRKLEEVQDEVIVQYFELPGFPDLAEILEASGRKGISLSDLGQRRHLRIKLGRADLSAVLRWESVYRVELFPRFQLFGERSSVISSGAFPADATCVDPGHEAWLARKGLRGGGVTVQVVDDGIDQGDASGAPGTAHPDLLGRIAGFDNATGSPTSASVGGHGTINAGIIAGSNASGVVDAAGFLPGLGLAPGARVFGTKIFEDSGLFDLGTRTLTDVYARAAQAGSEISSNSWGAYTFGGYDAAAAELDALVRDVLPAPGDQPLLAIFAAGNGGELTLDGASTTGSPATAKNVISVGAAESCDADATDGCLVGPEGANSIRDLIGFSSRGPNFDGRLGVTLVATGTHVTGPASSFSGYDGTGVCDRYWPSNQTLYARSSGTSHSTPQVSGAAALFLEHYRQSHDKTPGPALVKAALAVAARDLAGGQNGLGATLAPRPGPEQGWGSLALDELLPDEGAASGALFFDAPAALSDTGQEWETVVFSDSIHSALRIALAWTDPPAIPGAEIALVNDLDLEVEADGVVYRGNALVGGISVPDGTPDNRNNLEGVVLAPPPAYARIRVVARELAGDGLPGRGSPTDQDFALVVLGGAAQSSRGIVQWGSRVAGCTARAWLTVLDQDLAGAGSVEVTVKASRVDSPLRVTLPETAPQKGVFQAEVPLAELGGLGELKDGDLLQARYRDADDGTGVERERTDELRLDCTAPVIESIAVTDLDDQSATILVKTSEPTTVRVDYGGACDRLRARSRSRLLVTEHQIRLVGLSEATGHFFSVTAEDSAANTTTSNRGGGCYTFSTSRVDCSFEDDLEPTPGRTWSHLAIEGEDPWTHEEVPFARSPTHAWVATSFLDASDGVLILRGLDLNSSVRLTFWHLFFTDPTAALVLEVSEDRGKTWNDVDGSFLQGGYNSEATGGALAGRKCWNGTGAGQMSRVVVDPGSWSGTDRWLRFRFASGTGDAIWVIDDVSVCSSQNARGVLDADRTRVRCEDEIALELSDLDLRGTGEVGVEAQISGGAGLGVTLREDPPGSGVHGGSLSLGIGAGRLLARHGDRITLTYLDEHDGIELAPSPRTLELDVDCVAPRIGGIRVLEHVGTSVSLAWETDETTTSSAFVSTSFCGALDLEAASSLPGTTHTANLETIAEDVTHYVSVRAADLAGNVAVEHLGGRCFSFTPASFCPLEWLDDEALGAWSSSSPEGLPGWTFGTFSRARTPPACWFGAATSRRREDQLTSPPIPVVNGTFLRFWHTYGFESGYDGGVLEASVDGGATWRDLGPWIQPGGGYTGFLGRGNPIGDRPAWTGGSPGGMTPVVVDLGAFAGRTLNIRFRLGTDSSSGGDGWFVDDVEVCVGVRSQASLLLDRTSYPCRGTVQIHLLDVELLGNGTTLVKAFSPRERGGKVVVLNETPARSGHFAGNISLGPSGPAGTLEAGEGDTIEVRAFDVSNGEVGARELVATAAVDCSAPVLLSTEVLSVDERSATIAWESATPSTGMVELGGACRSFERTVATLTPGTRHVVTVTDLEPGQLYFYRVRARDDAGNDSALDAGGACYPVRTALTFCTFEDSLDPAPLAGWANPTGEWTVSANALATSRPNVWSISRTTKTDAPLVFPPLEPGPRSQLRFHHRFNATNVSGGGVAELSLDGGASWSDLGEDIVEGQYDDLYFDEATGESRPAWVSSPPGRMSTVRINLGKHAGKTCLVRLRLLVGTVIEGSVLRWIFDDPALCEPVGSNGAVAFSRKAYPCGSIVSVHVTDANAQEPVSVLVSSSSMSRPERVLLQKLAGGGYRGTISILDVQVPGAIFATDGDDLTAVYEDPSLEPGGPLAVEGHSRIDCSSPQVTGIHVDRLGGLEAEIEWSTDEPGTSSLRSGGSCGGPLENAFTVTRGSVHAARIFLAENSATYFKLEVVDEAGNASQVDNQGACFEIPLDRACTFEDPVDAQNAGWAHAAAVGVDRWRLANSSHAHTGARAWQSTASDEDNDSALTSPPIQVAQESIAVFWHWFSLESISLGGTLEIAGTDGIWTDLGPRILEGGYNDTLFTFDGGFFPCWSGSSRAPAQRTVVDLSPWEGQTVKLRYRLRGFTFGGQGNGWHIDDVAICTYGAGESSPRYARGNCASDGRLDLSDVVFLLNFLYRGGLEPTCQRACDTTSDGRLDLSDAALLLTLLFQGAGPLPTPTRCGADLEPGALTCGADSCLGDR